MRVSYQSNKKGVSLMVSYVILISMTLALSVIVYQWLQAYAGEDEVEECPAGVSVSITKIECNQSLGIPPGQGELKVHLANKGRFTVEDVLIRVSNNPDSKFGIEEMPIEEAFPQSPDPANTISPGNSKRYSNYHMSDQDAGVGYKDVKLVDVQPYYMKDGKKTLCKSYTTQKITCGA